MFYHLLCQIQGAVMTTESPAERSSRSPISPTLSQTSRQRLTRTSILVPPLSLAHVAGLSHWS